MTNPSLPPPTDTELEALADASAALQGIPVRAEWKPTVLANLRVLAAAARTLDAVPLDDALEPAPVFRA